MIMSLCTTSVVLFLNGLALTVIGPSVLYNICIIVYDVEGVVIVFILNVSLLFILLKVWFLGTFAFCSHAGAFIDLFLWQ